MKKDIQTRIDIELLVNVFYAKIIEDNLLGNIFQEIAKVNWPKHLATTYDFWENIILFTGNYEGNPMNLHQHLHDIAPLETAHFDRWNKLFIDTLDSLFEGERAQLAKQRAISISNIIKEKLLAHQQTNK
ncbi:MAG: group III truncated hemoglobin [Ferruginibacter sp.]